VLISSGYKRISRNLPIVICVEKLVNLFSYVVEVWTTVSRIKLAYLNVVKTHNKYINKKVHQRQNTEPEEQ